MKKTLVNLGVYVYYGAGILLLVMGLYGAICTATPPSPTAEQEKAYYEEVERRYGATYPPLYLEGDER